MAICRICGVQNRRLPANWVNWECWQCVIDSYTSYTEPTSREVGKAVIADLKEKRDQFNVMMVDMEMHIALKEAESIGHG